MKSPIVECRSCRTADAKDSLLRDKHVFASFARTGFFSPTILRPEEADFRISSLATSSSNPRLFHFAIAARVKLARGIDSSRIIILIHSGADSIGVSLLLILLARAAGSS
jgi:hypothetical protein